MQKRAPLSESRTNTALWEARVAVAAAEEQSLICRLCLVQSFLLHGDGRDGSGGRESFGVGGREGALVEERTTHNIGMAAGWPFLLDCKDAAGREEELRWMQLAVTLQSFVWCFEHRQAT